MLSNDLLFHIHLRLNEIFGKRNDDPFAGLKVIAVGDFFQFPPVGGKPVYADYKNNWQYFNSLWKLFKVNYELMEVMPQRGDPQFIDLLNNVRTTDIHADDTDMLKSRVIESNDNNYPHEAHHIFVKNANAKRHNSDMLQSTEGNIFSVSAIDNIPKIFHNKKLRKCLIVMKVKLVAQQDC